MRNLKKVLSLALCLVMLLGMMVVGAGAAEYKDAADIENKEAVAVLTKIGVVEGTDGNFNPSQVLNRAEGAAFIYRMLTGGTVKTPSAGVTGFVDVDNNPDFVWAKGIIADLAQKKIISGEDPTHFNPAGELTGAAFGKMLLVALGYNAETQGYTGGGWEGNVIRDAYGRSITVNGVVMTNKITRDQAAQMAFQTLEATMVYQKGGIQVGDVVIPGDAAEEIKNDAKNDYAGRKTGDDKDELMQFCEAYFPNLKLTTADDDDFGRPGGNKWTYNKETAYSTTKAPAYSIVVNANGKKTDDWAGKAHKGLKTSGNVISVNGAEAANNATVGNLTVGTLVEFYDVTDNVAGKVIVTQYSVGKITTLSTNKDGDVRYYVTAESGLGSNANGTDYADEKTADTVVVEGSVEKGDLVTYAVADDVLYIYPTTSFEGTQKSFKATSRTINIDGEDYTIFGTIAMDKFPNSADAATFYVDKNNFVVKSEAVAQSKDYAIIDSIALQLSGDGLTSNQSVKAILVFPDGTSKTVEVSSINGLDTSKSAKVAATTGGDTNLADLDTDAQSKLEKIWLGTQNDPANKALNGAIVTYVEKDEKYALTLKNVTLTADMAGNGSDASSNIVLENSTGTAFDATSKTITVKGVNNVGYQKNGSSVDTFTTTNSTQFVVKTGAGKWSAFTGFREVPSITAGTASKVYCQVESGKATLVYIDLSDDTNGGGIDGEVGRILFVTGSEAVSVGNDECVYAAIVDGKDEDVKTKEDAVKTILDDSDNKGKLYTVTESDGYVSTLTPVVMGPTTYDESVLASNVDMDEHTIGAYVFEDDVDAYVISDYKLTEDGIEAAELGDTIYVKTKGTTAGTVEAKTVDSIYIIKGKAVSFTSGTPDVDVIQKNLETGDKKVTLGAVTLNDDVSVPSGGTLVITNTVSGSGKIELNGGTVEVKTNAKLPTLADNATGTIKVNTGNTAKVGDNWDDVADSAYASKNGTMSTAEENKYTANVARPKVTLSGDGKLEGWGTALTGGKHVYTLNLEHETPDGTGAFVTGDTKCYYTDKSGAKHTLTFGSGGKLTDNTNLVLLLPTDVATIVLTYDSDGTNTATLPTNTYTFTVTG